jgi:outer membrane phospholipase A
VFWELNRITQPKIGEYDGIRLLLSGQFDVPNEFVTNVKLSALLRTGYQAFHFSQRYEATIRVKIKDFSIPLYAFYFNGYGRELSTYHEKNSYYGIGVEFW